jgi:ribonuclease E
VIESGADETAAIEVVAEPVEIEAPVEVVVEALVAPAPAPIVEPAPQPVAEPEPVAEKVQEPAEPDPAEILAPPAKPRGGWWRRG